MAVNRMIFNGSGYKDPTAFKAISNVEKEARKKMLAQEYVEGDIVLIETAVGDMEMLILKCHKSYATGLKLTVTRPEENCISIRSKQMMYSDTGRFVYTYYDKIISFIRAMDSQEYEDVRDAVARTMGFRIEQVGVGSEPMLYQVNKCGMDLEVITQGVQEALSGSLAAHDDLIRVTAERDVYKKLFEDLMGK